MLVRGEGKKEKGQLERKGGDVEPEPGMWGSWRSHPGAGGKALWLLCDSLTP